MTTPIGSVQEPKSILALKALLLPALVLVGWQLGASVHWLNPILSSPVAVGDAAREFWASGELAQHLAMSLRRMLLGLTFGVVAGVGLGGLMSLSQWADRLVTPLFRALMQVSVFAWIPLISIWMGTTEEARVLIVALVVMFPVTLSVYDGIRNIPVAYAEIARVLRLPFWLRLRKLVMPAAMSTLLAGLELATLYSWLAVVGVELLVSNGVGIGSMMHAGQELFRMDLVFLGVLLSGVVGYGIALTAGSLRKRLTLEGTGAIR